MCLWLRSMFGEPRAWAFLPKGRGLSRRSRRGRVFRWLTDPLVGTIPSEYSESAKKEDGSVDYEDVRFYPVIGRECFCELYLGVNVEKDKQNEILDVARWLNPEIKIYKMTVDPDAFRLKPQTFDFI